MNIIPPRGLGSGLPDEVLDALLANAIQAYDQYGKVEMEADHAEAMREALYAVLDGLRARDVEYQAADDLLRWDQDRDGSVYQRLTRERLVGWVRTSQTPGLFVARKRGATESEAFHNMLAALDYVRDDTP